MKYLANTLTILATLLFPLQIIAADSPDDTFNQEPQPFNVEDVDILFISEKTKAWLDNNIGPSTSRSARAVELHKKLFHPWHRGISYNNEKTKTAQETFDTGSGNCVSLASLYIASARYLGLKAQFQTVRVPRDWQDQKNFYVVPGHMNAVIKLPNEKVTVEFTNMYSAENTQFYKSRKISDTQALAEYYNNVGMELFEQGERLLAISYLNKSVNTYDKLALSWSNLGVAYKLTGKFEDAEEAYRKALKIDPSNLSIMNNLFILYNEQGNEEASEKLEKKVERYSRRNPYYLYKLAIVELEAQNYNSAIKHLKRAIRKKPQEAKFHLLLGQSYFYSGNLEKSAKYLDKAVALAQDPETKEQYSNKLKTLTRLSAGI